MISVKVDKLLLSNMGFVVLLKGPKDERSLPIFIGAPEAQAIAIQLNGVSPPRPLTHDLLKNLLDFMECRLMRIEVCDLKDGTFYARLILDRDGHQMSLDSRPSDAMALALRTSAPIYVAEKVMDEAGRIIPESEVEEAGAGKGEGGEQEKAQPAEPQSPEEARLQSLKQALADAVQEERYEDAARLRDEIKQFDQPSDN